MTPPRLLSRALEPPRVRPVLHISDPPAGFPLPLLGGDGQLAKLCGRCGLQHPAWVPIHSAELSGSLRPTVHVAVASMMLDVTFG